MRVRISVAASLMLMLALVGPVVAATGPGCSGFGAASAAGGHREIPGFEGLPFGQFVSDIKDGVIPGFTGVGQLVQFEHGVYCPK